MVSRTTWHKIAAVLLVVFGFTVGLSLRGSSPTTLLPVYSATNTQLDLAVVDGIAKTKHDGGVSSNDVKAVVIPHHLVASEAIALGVSKLSPKFSKRVVIISPDHFNLCPTLLCTTTGEFQTFFGDVRINQEIVTKLLSHHDLVTSSNLFTSEHGIFTIVPFIKHYLPQAEIVPLAVSQQGREASEKRSRFVTLLRELTRDEEVIIIVSSDFSHYLTLAEAEEKDRQTLTTICQKKIDGLLSLSNPSQSDCPLCLWALAKTAEGENFWNPEVIWHSNSAVLLKDTTVKSTTSHFVFTLSTVPHGQKCPNQLRTNM